MKLIARMLAACWLATNPAAAVELLTTIEDGGGVLCSGVLGEEVLCEVDGAVGQTVTVTLALSEASLLNGYDLNLSWDDSQLTLLSSSQLFPDSGPPDTVPFLIAPNPADPAGSQALVISLVELETTELLSLEFQLAALMPRDCVIDLSWSANGNGLSPAGVVLENPEGVSLDLGVVTQCSDGLDNNDNGEIDFDGGACANAGTPVTPDIYCASFTDNTERRRRRRSCGLGAELGVLIPGLWLVRRHRRRARR